MATRERTVQSVDRALALLERLASRGAATRAPSVLGPRWRAS